MRRSEKKERVLSESFVSGVIAIIFLVIGYQAALFVQRAAILKIAADMDNPDTVIIRTDIEPMSIDHTVSNQSSSFVEYRKAAHSPRVQSVRNNLPSRNIESFRFDPNTVSVEDLCRLGFTVKQAQSIDNYRTKGGRFRRKSDFARSFVVSDSVYSRLESYIDIPLLDLNLADSAAFDALPGIGGWFAAKIIEYRQSLGGYSYKEQLMDIYRFDQQKYDALSDLIVVSPEHVVPYSLWTLPADSLRLHPYIRNYETAKAIVLYRETNPPSEWTVEGLASSGILSQDSALKLSLCQIR